ncbi:DUF6439 family protein [Prochlorococcus sp. MIT 1307]|uniref:DUF6439 family protein n=1 Tax=Prochlorococcus sp. MIT 1307 TaxID=3096219 RepID=UPI002A74DE9A|nr:DUF6439 family protein [Prochlorococcus sp. MIT 1307]
MTKWPSKAQDLSIKLHAQLSLNDKNWHKYKNDPNRRAAELLAGALVQLISGGKEADITELINQSMRWVKREIKAPSCPDR